ncbi:MAG: hypothetical protein WKF43_02615 [Acidimicrobiales bacterium]
MATVLSMAALYVWDDALFAAPIVVTVGVLGTVPAFLILGTLYGVVNWIVALLAVRAYDRRTHGEPSRLETWIEAQVAGRRGAWAQRVIASGKVVGFVVASFVLGGIVTTWLMRYMGERKRIGMIAVASSAIFAITFVGFYSGVGRLLVDR